MLEIIGFVLLVSACGDDACDALPVTDDIYSKQECEIRLEYIQKKRPNLVFFCSEVLRQSSDIPDNNN